MKEQFWKPVSRGYPSVIDGDADGNVIYLFSDGQIQNWAYDHDFSEFEVKPTHWIKCPKMKPARRTL